MEDSHALILYQNKLFGEGLESILHKNNIVVSKISFDDLTNLGHLKRNFDKEFLLIETNWPFHFLDRFLSAHSSWNGDGIKTILVPNIINKHLVKIIHNAKVDGLVLKSGDTDELFFAIKQVLKGEKYFSSVLSNIFLKTNSEQSIYKITRREKEVLCLLAKMNSTKEIANILSISPTTVKTHRRNLMNKFKTKNLFNLLQYACRANLLNEGIHMCDCCQKQFTGTLN